MLVVSGAQFLEQEQRTLSKLDAALAAQRAQLARIADLQGQMVRAS